MQTHKLHTVCTNEKDLEKNLLQADMDPNYLKTFIEKMVYLDDELLSRTTVSWLSQVQVLFIDNTIKNLNFSLIKKEKRKKKIIGSLEIPNIV